MYIVTEFVTPLSTYLDSLSGLNEERKQLLISWGLFQVAVSIHGLFLARLRAFDLGFCAFSIPQRSEGWRNGILSCHLELTSFHFQNAVKFLCQDAKLIHNNVRLDTVYVNKCGEWKLFGFEYLTSQQNSSSVPVKPYGLEKYNAPECKSGNISASESWYAWQVLNSFSSGNQDFPSRSVDSWGLGCFIWEVFNGPLTTGGIAQLKAPKAIPKMLHQPYAKLLAPNPAQRLTPEQFIEMCRKPGGFMRNKVVDCLIFLEEFHVRHELY